MPSKLNCVTCIAFWKMPDSLHTLRFCLLLCCLLIFFSESFFKKKKSFRNTDQCQTVAKVIKRLDTSRQICYVQASHNINSSYLWDFLFSHFWLIISTHDIISTGYLLYFLDYPQNTLYHIFGIFVFKL